MRLRTSAGAELENPSGQEIERTLSILPVDRTYEAVLSAGEDRFIQARGEVSEEWADGAPDGLMLHGLEGPGHMFESAKRHPSSTVIRLFQLYAQGNPQWQREVAWREYKSAARSIVLLGAIILGAFVLWWLLR